MFFIMTLLRQLIVLPSCLSLFHSTPTKTVPFSFSFPVSSQSQSWQFAFLYTIFQNKNLHVYLATVLVRCTRNNKLTASTTFVFSCWYSGEALFFSFGENSCLSNFTLRLTRAMSDSAISERNNEHLIHVETWVFAWCYKDTK